MLRLPTALLIACLALAGCGSVVKERRYTGELLPESACGAPTHGTMTTADGKFSFTPTDGVLMIRGDVGADGSVSGQLAPVGADKKPYVMAFTGKVSPEKVEGRFVTPRCAFSVSLAYVSPSFF